MEAVVLSERIDVLRDLLLQAEYRADAATAAAGQVADTVRAAVTSMAGEMSAGAYLVIHAALDAAPPPRREADIAAEALEAAAEEIVREAYRLPGLAAVYDLLHARAAALREAGEPPLNPNTHDLDPRQEP
jgi:hypothetical protein